CHGSDAPPRLRAIGRVRGDGPRPLRFHCSTAGSGDSLVKPTANAPQRVKTSLPPKTPDFTCNPPCSGQIETKARRGAPPDRWSAGAANRPSDNSVRPFARATTTSPYRSPDGERPMSTEPFRNPTDPRDPNASFTFINLSDSTKDRLVDEASSVVDLE